MSDEDDQSEEDEELELSDETVEDLEPAQDEAEDVSGGQRQEATWTKVTTTCC